MQNLVRAEIRRQLGCQVESTSNVSCGYWKGANSITKMSKRTDFQFDLHTPLVDIVLEKKGLSTNPIAMIGSLLQ